MATGLYCACEILAVASIVAHRISLDFIGFAVVEVCVGVGGWFIATKSKKSGIIQMTNNLGSGRHSVRAAICKSTRLADKRTAQPAAFSQFVCHLDNSTCFGLRPILAQCVLYLNVAVAAGNPVNKT